MTDIGDVAGRTIAAGATGFAAGGPIGALVGVATQLVPELIRALAGDPAGQTAQQIASVVQTVAGTDDAVAAAAALSGDPAKALEARIKLTEIAVAAEAARQQHQLEVLKAELADTSSARNQTIELARIGSSLAWMPAVQTVAVTFLFSITLAALLINLSGLAQLPDGYRDILMVLVGALTVEFRGACQYWIGGSRAGAAAATAGLQQAVSQLPPAKTLSPAPAAAQPARRSIFTRS